MAGALERGWPLLLPAALLSVYGWAAWRRFRVSGTWPMDWTEPIRRWLEAPPVWAGVQPLLERPRLVLAFLEGACGKERLARWAAEGAGLAGILLGSGGFISFLAGEPGMVALFAVLAAAAPFLRWKDLNRKAEERRRQIRRAMPELLVRLAIVVNAGENVMRALERCAMSKDHPLALELASALEAMNRGESMAAALEEFGRRCGIPEAKRFASAVLINMRRGGDSFTAALQDLARTMWEQRKAEARTLGELASSRLSFPLAVIFLIVMAMVGTPTLLMMG